MKVPRILWAMLACAALAFEVEAAEPPEHGGSATAANAGDASGPIRAEPSRGERGSGSRTALGRDTNAKAARADDSESTRLGSAKGAGSKRQDAAVAVPARRGSLPPPRKVGPLARSNADRLHSLLSTKARAARLPSRPGGSIRTATGNVAARAPGGASPAHQPTAAAATRAARSATPFRAATPNSTLGGPQVPRPGRLGAPAVGRTAHNASIDGTQLRHKF
jgi:hypothetical protein